MAPGTVASMPWKLRPNPSGIAAICSPSMIRPVSARSVWSAGASEVTVTVSETFAGLERQIDAHGRVDVHLHVVAHDFLEPAELGFHAINAVAQIRERVEAALVRRRRRRRCSCVSRWPSRSRLESPPPDVSVTVPSSVPRIACACAADAAERQDQRRDQRHACLAQESWNQRHSTALLQTGSPIE